MTISHIMLDIETLGTRPGAVILAVALVRFDDEARVQINLSVPEQLAAGAVIDPATHQWWSTQDPAAWQNATENPRPAVVGLEYVTAWLTWARAGRELLIWCHGATFDGPLLAELYRLLGLPCPWQFWQVRDTRTLYDLAGVDHKAYAVPPPHIALNDALGQTRAAVAALRVLQQVRVAA